MAANSLRCTVSRVITLARMLSVRIRSLVLVIATVDEDCTSKLHQPPRPQLPARINSPKSIVEHHLAQIHHGHQEDVIVQRQCH